MADLFSTTSGGGLMDFNNPQAGVGNGNFVPLEPGQSPMEFFLRGVPGYKFAFSEGQRAAQTGAAARGTLLTGGTLKALARYGTGLADQTYGDTVNRYLSLADLGLRASTLPFA